MGYEGLRGFSRRDRAPGTTAGGARRALGPGDRRAHRATCTGSRTAPGDLFDESADYPAGATGSGEQHRLGGTAPRCRRALQGNTRERELLPGLGRGPGELADRSAVAQCHRRRRSSTTASRRRRRPAPHPRAPLARARRRPLHRHGQLRHHPRPRRRLGQPAAPTASWCTTRKPGSLYISPGQARPHPATEYFDRGEPCPVAMVVRQRPAAVPGGLHGDSLRPERVRLGRRVRGRAGPGRRGAASRGCRLPPTPRSCSRACAAPSRRWPKGPFGEWTGYYATAMRAEPVLHVEAMYYRNARS